MKQAILVIAFAVSFATIGFVMGMLYNRVPVCPEDAAAVGTGDYVGGVGWSAYHCEALDDLR